MPIVKCSYCGKEVFKSSYSVNRARNNFCSVECSNKFKCKANVIIEKENYAEIIINKDNKEFKVLISKEDIEKVNEIKWTLKYDKTINGYYVGGHTRGVCCNKRKTISLHRFLFDFPQDMQIDHINRNTLDNRRENLRCISSLANSNNKGFYSNNKSGYKYIYYKKASRCWTCEIKRFKKVVFRKYCKDLEKLIQLRDKFIKENTELWCFN